MPTTTAADRCRIYYERTGYPVTRRPLGVGTGTTALLATLAPFEADALLDALGERLGPSPNLSLQLIRDRVLEARRCGYAMVSDLIVDGLGGVAIALQTPAGDVVGAFSILRLTERITGRIEELVALLKQGKRKPIPTVDGRALGNPCGNGVLAVPGEELAEPGSQVPARQLIDGMGKVGFGVEAVQLCRLDQGVEDGGAVAALVGSQKQEILAGNRDAAHQSFGHIVVDGEPAIVGVARQRFPTS